MKSLLHSATGLGLLLALCVWPCALAAQNAVMIQHIAVKVDSSGPQIEIGSSGQTIPETQLIRNPDRIVIDFPNSTPSRSLHAIAVNRGEVVRVRVGQFTANPPVTRVVLDLKSPVAYQLVPAGKSVIVKLGSQSMAAVVPRDVPPALAPTPSPRLQVSWVNGMLTIRADKATFAEVLDEIHRKVGTEIAFAQGSDNGAAAQQIAAQDKVFTELGPAPERDVLLALLDGSRFNFVMMGSERNASDVSSILLTPRSGGTAFQPTGNYVPPPPQRSVPAEPAAPPPGTPAPDGFVPGEKQPPEEEAPVELPEQEQPQPQDQNFAGAPPTR